MVKRYSVHVDYDSGGIYQFESPEGGHVAASDYDALAARLAEAEHLLREAMGERNPWEGPAIGTDSDLFRQVEAFLAGTSDSADEGLTVKSECPHCNGKIVYGQFKCFACGVTWTQRPAETPADSPWKVGTPTDMELARKVTKGAEVDK